MRIHAPEMRAGGPRDNERGRQRSKSRAPGLWGLQVQAQVQVQVQVVPDAQQSEGDRQRSSERGPAGLSEAQ